MKAALAALSSGDSSAEKSADDKKPVSTGVPRLVLLQCTSSYPCLPADTNLRVILTYKQTFPSVLIGYSGEFLYKQ